MTKLSFQSILLLCIAVLNAQIIFCQAIRFDKKTVYQIAKEDFSKHAKVYDRLSSKPENSIENLFSFEKSGVEFNISNSKEAESEIHAAINPKDSNNIIVATMQYSEDFVIPFSGDSQLKIIIYFSRDGGKSWKKSKYNPLELPLLTLPSGGGDPVIAFDSQGRVYLTSLLIYSQLIGFGTYAELNYAFSSDGGENWVAKGSVEKNNITLANYKIIDKEWIAMDRFSAKNNGNLYCGFTEINLGDTTYNIYVKRKTSKVDSFEKKRIPITKGNFAFAQFVTLDVDRNGTVHLLFAGAKPEDETLSLFYSTSNDAGISFSVPQKIIEIAVPCFPLETGSNCSVPGFATDRIYPCPSITTDKSNGSNNVYILWSGLDLYQQKGQSGMDVFIMRSNDGGKTWIGPKKINKDGLNGIEQFYPSCYVNEKGICSVSWYDRREDPKNITGRYYMTSSCNAGISFLPEMAVSMQAMDFTLAGKINGGFGVGEYTQIISTGSTVFPFWSDGRTNNGNLEVFTSRIPLTCSLPVAVHEIQNLSKDLILHQAFPNPAEDILRLDLEAEFTGEISLTCFGVDGRKVLEKKLNIINGRQTISLPVEGLNTGVYWLDLQFKKSRIAIQFVKE